MLIAGCGGDDIELPGGGPAPTGPAAAPADAEAACLILARSTDDLQPPTDLSQPAPTYHRLQSLGGLIEAAARYDGRFKALQEAIDPVASAAEQLNDSRLTDTIPAALAACRKAGLPTDKGDGPSAQADAAAGCAAVARSRDLFTATDFRAVTFEANLRLGGAEALFLAASEADSRYRPLYDAIKPVLKDLVVLAVDRLHTSGAGMLAACEHQGLPHE